MADFVDSAGLPALPVLTDGAVPVALRASAGSDPADLLAELIWEVRALRRVQCEAHDKLFDEYPG